MQPLLTTIPDFDQCHGWIGEPVFEKAWLQPSYCNEADGGVPQTLCWTPNCWLKATFTAGVLRIGSRPLPASVALESGVLGPLSEGERVMGSGAPWLVGDGRSEASVLLDAVDRLILKAASGLPRSRRSAGPVRGGKAMGASGGEPARQRPSGFHTGEAAHGRGGSRPDSVFDDVHRSMLHKGEAETLTLTPDGGLRHELRTCQGRWVGRHIQPVEGAAGPGGGAAEAGGSADASLDAQQRRGDVLRGRREL